MDEDIKQILLRDKEYDEQKIEELKFKISECERMIPLYKEQLARSERSLEVTINALNTPSAPNL